MAFMMINFADKAVIGLTADDIMAELGLTATGFGLIVSAFYFLFSASAAVVGLLGDRLPVKWLLAGLAVIWSLAQLPVLLPAAGAGVLLGTRILLGAGEGPGFPMSTHAAMTWFPERARSLPASLVTTGAALGGVIGVPLLGLVLAAHGWRATFGVLGVAGLVWAAAWLRWGGEGPYGKAHGGAEGPYGKAIVGAEADADADGPPVPLARVLATGTWAGSVLSAFAVMWTLALATAWLPLYLEKQRGYGSVQVGLLSGLPSAGAIVLALGAGAASQRLLRRGVPGRLAQGLLGGGLSVLAGLSLLLVTRLDAAPLLLAAVAVAFSAGTAQTPLNNAALADCCPPARRSAALGAGYAVAALATIAAPAVTGRLLDAAPDAGTGFARAFDLAAVLLMAGGVVAALTVRPERDRARLAAEAVVRARPPARPRAGS
ncbi:MFS transporter [Streptomyces sp. A7024]|uniref:MFS transporter n=2 Tax=Streptomyces coryli TaxID=1128680 RepID=A0A6G4TWU7_9ACTN|nr:MFS transporter [Streptomyces coryli]